MLFKDLDLEAFDYQVGPDRASFRVRVVRSPVDSQRLSDAERVTITPALRQQLARLEQQDLDLQALISVGRQLGDLLFPPVVRSFLVRSRQALKQDEGLRIRLKLDTYALADLPWEYVYVTDLDTPGGKQGRDGFLVLDRRISLVRFEVLGEPPIPLEPVGPEPMRMVAMFAAPEDPNLPRLKLDVEQNAIQEALQQVPYLRVEPFPNASLASLENALTTPAQVFHFSGHGLFDGNPDAAYGSEGGRGFLVLEDEQHKASLLAADTLALYLRGSGVRLAMLGACGSGRRNSVNPWSGVAAAVTKAGIPAVVGMQYVISDRNSIHFSRRFYQILAKGQSIDEAVTAGRLAVLSRTGEDDYDWGVPVLYLRVEDSAVLFPASAVAQAGSTWQDLLARAREQTDRFLRQVRGTAERPGVYLPELFVTRQQITSQLEQFLDGEAQALVLVGEPGRGKTNLLCHWTESLLAGGHGVFFYNCGGSIGLDIEREVAQDLSLATPAELVAALEQIAQQASSAERQFVLIFDAINLFHGESGAGPQALLKRLDALIGRLPRRNVRLVLSCSAATWSQLWRWGIGDLFLSRYFTPSAIANPRFLGQPVVELAALSQDELAAAYPRYQDFFQLATPLAKLPPGLRQRLQEPQLLRMHAEAWRGRREQVAEDALALGIVRRYFDERVKRREDRLLVDDLAGRMLAQQSGALFVDDLARDPLLRPEFRSDNPDSSYYRLLDAGVLAESVGDPLQGDMVQFNYSGVGAYALALHLLRGANAPGTAAAPADIALLTRLSEQARQFPLAWDAAQTILLLRKNEEIFTSLARSANVELRELAVDGLVALAADEPDPALAIVRQLLENNSTEIQRTALKAAYAMGPLARSLFLWAARKGSPGLRRSTKDILYLIWRHDPDFVYGLLQELASQINLGALADLRKIIEFILDLSITVYINHCDQPGIVQQTSDLWYDILVNRVHMNWLNTGILGPAVEKLIFQAVAAAFARPLLDTVLFTELVPADRFFSLSEEAKAPLRRVLPLLDPQASLGDAESDLVTLFESDVSVFNVAAAVAVSVHAYQDFAAQRPLLDSLLDKLGVQGRSWLLMSFAVLLTDVPAPWLDWLEEATRRTVREFPGVLVGEGTGVLQLLDLSVVLVPLGLTYAKRGPHMPYVEQLIRENIQPGNEQSIEKILQATGVLGFYYPEAALAVFRSAIDDWRDPRVRSLLVLPLATMRTLHMDAVDVFLGQVGADVAFQRQVWAATDIELVRRYIYWLGIYNNAVHQALFYPKMRRQLLIGGLTALADAANPKEFIVRETTVSIRMVREADFRLSAWTLPD